MPAISLVVCVHKERDLLARLLRETSGLFDDLVVVHDGSEENGDSLREHPVTGTEDKPLAIDYSDLAGQTSLPEGYVAPTGPAKPGSIQQLVTEYGGKYFEGPRCFQQEPHWPFAWSQAKHDWILRLDSDEFPSEELKTWLKTFISSSEPSEEISGYTCIWPIWNGKRAVTRQWPAGRNFLFHRGRVRFFGVVEYVPAPDTRYEPLPLVLRHQPSRKSHGLQNVLVRKQGGLWRWVIAQSLLKEPLELPHWRLINNEWPIFWDQLRKHPIRAGLYFFVRNTLATLRQLWRSERKFMPLISVATPLHHLLVGLSLYRLQKSRVNSGKADRVASV